MRLPAAILLSLSLAACGRPAGQSESYAGSASADMELAKPTAPPAMSERGAAAYARAILPRGARRVARRRAVQHELDPVPEPREHPTGAGRST